MNKVYLIGRLTNDPELRKTNNDLSVCRFTLAVNRDYVKGEEKQADFINCIAWRNQADNLARYIRKGGLIAIDGMIQTGSYDDANGKKVFTTDIVANHIEFLESAKKQDNNTYQQYQQKQEARRNQFEQQFNNATTRADITADDLPF